MSELLHPIDAYYERARELMAPASWAYLNGGAVDEISVRRNPDRYSEIALLPRVGVDVSELQISQRLLGVDLPFPIMLAPAALQLLFAEEGELGTVRGAKAAGTAAVISMESSIPTRELAKESGPFFQHIYVQRDRALTLELVRMAEEAGARGIAVTLDNPVPGIRYRQDAGMIGLPEGVRRANLESGGVPRLTGGYLDPSMTWKDLEWLVSHTELPVIGKGVLHPDDARLSIESGLQAVFVSNHGGRQLDRAPVPFHLLPHVVREVGKDATVMVETGIMNGADIVESIALGTKFTLIGRAYLYGLMAAAGRASTGPSPSSAARSNAPWPSSASQPSPNSSPATSRNSPGWSQSGTAPERRRSGEVAPRGPRGRIVRYRTKPSATTAECGRLEGG